MTEKKQNIILTLLKKLNNFFSLYEKIWLATFIGVGILVTIIMQETFLHLVVLVCGLLMELTLSKRSKWCFLFVFLNSAGLIAIGLINSLYSEMIINLFFWIPYSIFGFFHWHKNIDEDENKNLTRVRGLKVYQTLIIVFAILGLGVLWGMVLTKMGGSYPYFDAFSTLFQLVTGILILTRLKEQWFFWIAYILVSATIWIMFGYWVMLIISFGYLSNSIYGYILWKKYIYKNE